MQFVLYYQCVHLTFVLNNQDVIILLVKFKLAHYDKSCK